MGLRKICSKDEYNKCFDGNPRASLEYDLCHSEWGWVCPAAVMFWLYLPYMSLSETGFKRDQNKGIG